MIYIIGEAPVAGALHPYQWLHPRYCASGRRLLDYSGWTVRELEQYTVRGNLYGAPVTSGSRAGAYQLRWEAPVARASAELAAHSIHADHPTVLLGQRVAEAFGAYTASEKFQWEGDDSLFQWFESDLLGRGNAGLLRCAIVPHPSGRNRWWNTPGNRDRARTFLRELMDEERP